MVIFSPQIPANFDLPMKVILIGEAPGAEEEREGKPFIGRSGQLLRKCLNEIGVDPNNLYVSNVFWVRPPDNDVKYFFAHKTLKGNICEDIDPLGSMFLKEEFRFHIDRLQNELNVLSPELVVAIGSTPLWALTGRNGISKIIGQLLEINGPVKHSAKCLPIYHPSYILRNRDIIPQWQEELIKIKMMLE